jgi:hypothetical protein
MYPYTYLASLMVCLVNTLPVQDKVARVSRVSLAFSLIPASTTHDALLVSISPV